MKLLEKYTSAEHKKKHTCLFTSQTGGTGSSENFYSYLQFSRTTVAYLIKTEHDRALIHES
jgi:hypothetical protein